MQARQDQDSFRSVRLPKVAHRKSPKAEHPPPRAFEPLVRCTPRRSATSVDLPTLRGPHRKADCPAGRSRERSRMCRLIRSNIRNSYANSDYVPKWTPADERRRLAHSSSVRLLRPVRPGSQCLQTAANAKACGTRESRRHANRAHFPENPNVVSIGKKPRCFAKESFSSFKRNNRSSRREARRCSRDSGGTASIESRNSTIDCRHSSSDWARTVSRCSVTISRTSATKSHCSMSDRESKVPSARRR